MFYKRFFVAGLAMAATFATLLLTVIAGMTLSAAASFSKTEAPAPPPPIPRLATNLRGELNTALSPEFAFNFDTAGNPFDDKTGVSLATRGNKNTAASANQNLNFPDSTGSSTPPKISSSVPTNRISVQPFPVGISPPQTGQPTGAVMPIERNLPTTAAIDTNQLVRERQRQIRLGEKDVPDLPSLYSIDEVRPYGVVGSGTINRVKLYSPTTGQRFSVVKGTRFRDGSIESIGDEGVSFRRLSGELVFSRWAKNKDKSYQDGKVSADAPVLRVGEGDGSPK